MSTVILELDGSFTTRKTMPGFALAESASSLDGAGTVVSFGGPGDVPVPADYLGFGPGRLPGPGQDSDRRLACRRSRTRRGAEPRRMAHSRRCGEPGRTDHFWAAEGRARTRGVSAHGQGAVHPLPWGHEGMAHPPGGRGNGAALVRSAGGRAGGGRLRGSGRTQIAVYRPRGGERLLRERDGALTHFPWGGPGDQPVSAAFAPRFGP